MNFLTKPALLMFAKFIIAVCILFGLYYFIPSFGRTTTISPAELRKDLFDFTAGRFFIPAGNHYDIRTEYRCDDTNRCSVSLKAGNPAFAWALLFLAQAKVEYKSSDPTRHKLASELLDQTFRDWMITADGNADRFSLHQLYESGILTKDDQFMSWLRGRYHLSLRISQDFIQQYASTGKLDKNSYLLATLARQHWQSLHAMLEDPNIKSETPEESSINLISREEHLRETKEAVNKLLQMAASDAESGLDSTYIPISDTPRLPQMICFQSWARAASLSASSSLNKKERDFINLNDEVGAISDLLKQLLSILSHHSGGRFVALQSLLACLHTTKDFNSFLTLNARECKSASERCLQLSSSIISQDAVKKLFKLLAERCLLLWDGKQSSCFRDGGVFSQPVEAHTSQPFCQQDKGIVDNSWFSFILDSGFDDLQLMLEQTK